MKKYGVSLLLAFLAATMLFLYIPFTSYLGNVNEFAFDGRALLRAALPIATLMFLSMGALFCLAKRFLPCVPARFGAWRAHVGPLDVLVLVCLLGLWLEGAFLSRGLPAITGTPGLYPPGWRMWADLGIWAVLLCAAVFFWRSAVRLAIAGTLAFLLLLGAGIGDAVLSAEAKVPVYAERAEVLQNLSFHPTDNVIVIIADHLPTDAVEHVLQQNPDIAAELDGFLLFQNNLGTGGQTAWAIPSILQGSVYQGGSYLTFADRAFHAPSSLPYFFKSRGYSGYLSGLLPRFCAMWNARETMNPGGNILAKANLHLYAQLFFRFAPYSAKNLLEPYLIAHFAQRAEGGGTALNDEAIYAHYLIPGLDKVSRYPTFHFHHLFGAHFPYLRDGKGNTLPESAALTKEGLFEQSEWVLRCFVDFVRVLKLRGMYDPATIIFAADHGDYFNLERPSTFPHPTLMFKPRGWNGDLKYSKAPSSSSFIADWIIHSIDESSYINNIIPDMSDERYYLNYFYNASFTDQLMLVKGRNPSELIMEPIPWRVQDEPIPLTLKREYTFQRADVSRPLATPVYLENISPAGGIGLVLEGVEGAATFKVLTDKPTVDVRFIVHCSQIDPGAKNIPIPLTITDLNAQQIVFREELALSFSGPLVMRGVKLNEQGEVALRLHKATPPLGYQLNIQLILCE